MSFQDVCNYDSPRIHFIWEMQYIHRNESKRFRDALSRFGIQRFPSLCVVTTQWEGV